MQWKANNLRSFLFKYINDIQTILSCEATFKRMSVSPLLGLPLVNRPGRRWPRHIIMTIQLRPLISYVNMCAQFECIY